jgi:hypothetical protein
MGFGLEQDDMEVISIEAPVFCPCCNRKLDENSGGNRVCSNGFPPCCYMYWNAKEKKHYWKEGFGPDDIYDEDKKVWLKKEPTETIQ